MGKSNLLKEAIADAKAVRETALANARQRMEEAFTPRLQSMISAKLQNEIEGEDEEEVIEPEVEVEDEVETEPEIDVDVEPEGEEFEAEIESPEGEEEIEAEVEPEVEPEVSAEEPVEVEAEPEIEVEPSDDEDVEEVEEEGYDLDLESIIKELDAESDFDDEEDEPVLEGEYTDEGAKDDTDVTPDLSGEQGPNPKVVQKSPDKGQPFSTEKGGGIEPASTLKQNPKNAIYEEDEEEIEIEDENGEDEEINLDEILRELEEADLSASVPDEIPDESNPFASMNEQLKTKVGTLTKDLKEHRQVIKFLKSKLNEVNLLNAKLLFTSKLFKSNNMSNAEKMKIIESFDRAKTLREVKLVYSTIAESITVKSKSGSKTSIKKITESIGGASKPVKSTNSTVKTKKVISESIVSEEGAGRLQKLAGIKKKIQK